MKKQKIAYKTEEFEEMKKFVIVLIVVIILIVGIYFISKAVIKNSASLLTYQDGEIETDTIIVGTLLNRPEDEYYVLAYDSTSNQALAYTTYTSYYTSEQENPIKVYYLNCFALSRCFVISGCTLQILRRMGFTTIFFQKTR